MDFMRLLRSLVFVGLGLALWPGAAIAQLTINSSGVVGGTVTPPNGNPNFNQGTTRVDTDSQGRYFRNGELIFDASTITPNFVRVDANGRSYVDFRGIPVVGIEGALTSPILDGQLNSVKRFNDSRLVKFWGNIQDEFVVQGDFTGIATDPATGNQYQGTFRIRGQGPRYSDRNGGTSPTVFDFKSYYAGGSQPIPATRTVNSYTFSAMPVQLRVTIPAGTPPIAPGTPMTPGTPITPGTPVPLNPNIPSNPITPNPPASDLPESLVFNADTITEINHLVLREGRKRVGPRSRVLLR
jgi:hypothetical protein